MVKFADMIPHATINPLIINLGNRGVTPYPARASFLTDFDVPSRLTEAFEPYQFNVIAPTGRVA